MRDLLEQVLTNDRADTSAVAQRRHLAEEVPRAGHGPNDVESAEEAVAAAWRALEDARQHAEPFLQPLATAEADLSAAEAEL